VGMILSQLGSVVVSLGDTKFFILRLGATFLWNVVCFRTVLHLWL